MDSLAMTSVLPSPKVLKEAIPLSKKNKAFIDTSRQSIQNILSGQDKRLLVVVGPCSIHDVEAAKDYARRLAHLAHIYSQRMVIVMRTYFEKPRTSLGWKGLIIDPYLDGSYNLVKGLHIAREFLRYVIDLELPTATEILDVITPQYLKDCICWGAIGARTIESQVHRQLASGLPMPIGFKNNTAGSIVVAVHALKAAQKTHTFLGINDQGQASVITTTGNAHGHIILRGGKLGPNYTPPYIRHTESLLEEADLPKKIMVDCSHGNSGKDPQHQAKVLEDTLKQIQAGAGSIIGYMLESNLLPGSQPFPRPIHELTYGTSITDGCIGWSETESLLKQTFDAYNPSLILS